MAKSKLFGKRSAKLPHMVHSAKGGVSGEVGDLRDDVEATFADLEDNGGVLVLEEFTNLAAPSANAIKLAFATSNQAQEITTLDGAIGDDEMIPPRILSLTASANADVDAVGVVITGEVRNAEGQLVAQTDTITPADGGGTTVNGTKAFSKVSKLAPAAMGGSGGQLQVGTAGGVGLKRKLRIAAGLPVVVQQITNGALVTNGTFNAAATPHGTFTPNTAPNGAHDYAVLYAVDPA